MSYKLLPPLTYLLVDSSILVCINLLLVCRFTHYDVYLSHFEISKTSYIYEQREYNLIEPNLHKH
jgi:hypothetical protein